MASRPERSDCGSTPPRTHHARSFGHRPFFSQHHHELIQLVAKHPDTELVPMPTPILSRLLEEQVDKVKRLGIPVLLHHLRHECVVFLPRHRVGIPNHGLEAEAKMHQRRPHPFTLFLSFSLSFFLSISLSLGGGGNGYVTITMFKTQHPHSFTTLV